HAHFTDLLCLCTHACPGLGGGPRRAPWRESRPATGAARPLSTSSALDPTRCPSSRQEPAPSRTHRAAATMPTCWPRRIIHPSALVRVPMGLASEPAVHTRAVPPPLRLCVVIRSPSSLARVRGANPCVSPFSWRRAVGTGSH
ncbi:hypothetical protein FS749_012052, partial [Ceratobasidium sp. UAMH 11750]